MTALAYQEPALLLWIFRLSISHQCTLIESLDRQFVDDAVKTFRFHMAVEFSYASVQFRCSTSVHACGGRDYVEQIRYTRPPPTSSICDLRFVHDESDPRASANTDTSTNINRRGYLTSADSELSRDASKKKIVEKLPQAHIHDSSNQPESHLQRTGNKRNKYGNHATQLHHHNPPPHPHRPPQHRHSARKSPRPRQLPSARRAARRSLPLFALDALRLGSRALFRGNNRACGALFSFALRSSRRAVESSESLSADRGAGEVVC